MKIALKLFCIVFGFLASIASLYSIFHKSDGTIKATVMSTSILKAPDGDLKILTLSFMHNGVSISKDCSCDLTDSYKIGDTLSIDYFLSKKNDIESVQISNSKYKYIYPLLFIIIGLPCFIWGITVAEDLRKG